MANRASHITRRTLITAGAASLSLIGLPTALWAASAPRVRTEAGNYVGEFVQSARLPSLQIAQFLGIRYGIDTRHTRFQQPIVAPKLARTQHATTFGPACPQLSAQNNQSEDCLFLNIWTPKLRNKPRLPVMLYIHGGAYSNGSANGPLTLGTNLAAHAGAVVVTLNHRLNCFGYLYLARLSSTQLDSGNAGQWDLVLALQWLRQHIADFGGDPDNVTVFGQSGGGAKIATLMAMPAAAGLFHKALTMSGQQVTVSGPLNATRRTQEFLQAADLTAAQIATASTEQLLKGLRAVDPILGGTIYFGPVLDMRALTRHPFYPDAAAQSRAIPMIMGNTVAETRAFFPPTHPKLQDLSWANLAERIEPELRVDVAPEWVVAQFRKQYPSYSAIEVFYAATTASRSWRGQVIQAEARARAGSPAFVCQLNFAQAKHTDDIGLMFGTVDQTNAAAMQLSKTMMDALKRFVLNGEPGWPAYTLEKRSTMIFDEVSAMQDNPRAWERELFERIPYIQPGS